jgi:hypothetical protein
MFVLVGASPGNEVERHLICVKFMMNAGLQLAESSPNRHLASVATDVSYPAPVIWTLLIPRLCPLRGKMDEMTGKQARLALQKDEHAAGSLHSS